MVRTEIPFTYVVRRKLASGKFRDYWRFRYGETNVALPGAPGDAAFHERYGELLSREQRIAEEKTGPEFHTVDWLLDAFFASPEFEVLADTTQKDYRETAERIRPVIGTERFDSVTKQVVLALRNDHKATPRTSHKIKQFISRLYGWGDEQGLVAESFNPAAGVKRIKAKVKHIEVWSQEEIDLFLSKCDPVAKTIAMLALYTGQRRQDVATMDWKAYQGGVIRVRQNKTGTPLTIPCHPKLKAHLDAIKSPFGGSIVRNAQGRPMDANAVSSQMNRAVAAIADMPHRSLHGLRYAAASTLEAVGCTVAQIVSIIGHRTFQVAMQYASQRRDAEAAMALMEKEA
ncbi:tyrosine-type recombinase/integrase [Sphingopyxis sp. PET50]|uniref:tyrosine-type recombinase/integrase n=1 Tax=Sphingopyxis sp. PET50 TaxID=2976533 RepID=UPI0021AF2B06|nr:tyrosine-type recombinase/integrase [Sphingopyxis sp. PET50]